jgi:hypothetical protein
MRRLKQIAEVCDAITDVILPIVFLGFVLVAGTLLSIVAIAGLVTLWTL